MLQLIAAGSSETLSFILVALAGFLITAKLFGAVAERMHMPSIVGELLAGIVLGNLHLIYPEFAIWRDQLLHSEFMQISAEMGVIFLLFIVGLETNVNEMRKVGGNALVVAIIGVVLPFALGYGSGFLLPGLDMPNIEKIFLGAALTATSVGITAKVLTDSNALRTTEGQTILGAAVFDDVIGLMILAVVSGLAAGAAITFGSVSIIALKVLSFFVGAFLIGHFLLPHLIRFPRKWRGSGIMQSIALSVLFILSWTAAKLGLAPIVGAFTAGILLDETHFEGYKEFKSVTLEEIMHPITALFLPLFFVLMGMHVDLGVLASGTIIIETLILTGVAVVGKILAGYGLPKSKGDPLLVGYGMIPRGEVGLVFAAVGLNAHAISPAFYGVIVVVVVLTTIIAPILLRLRIKKLQDAGVMQVVAS